MPKTIRLIVNCLVVAGLTFGGFMVFVRLPILPISPNLWAGHYFEPATVIAMYLIYTFLLWGAFSALLAALMLVLKPRAVIIYGAVSALTFIMVAQPWHMVASGNVYGYLRDFVFLLTVPYLYWVFVRIVRQRHNLSLQRTREDAGR